MSRQAAARLLAGALAVGAMSAGITVLNAGSAAAAQNTCTPSAEFTNCLRFTSSGADQSFTVPAGVTSLDARMWGAAGGTAIGGYPGGGAGGYSAGRVSVQPGQNLTVMVGSGGGPNQAGFSVYGGGGGYAGPAGASQFGAGGGGGMSALWAGAANTAANALLIAGGGGGSPYVSVTPGNAGGGGGGGGSFGTSGGVNGGKAAGQTSGGGAANANVCPTPGTPGTQFNGGYGAAAGRPANGVGGEAGGGGGGGWFGGGGGGCRPNQTATAPGGGGGGSGYVNTAKVPTGATTAGSAGTTAGSKPPNTTDPLYVSGVGAAGTTQGGGGPGLVVLQWIAPTTWTQASVPSVAPGASGTTTLDNVHGSFSSYTFTAPVGLAITGWSGCAGTGYSLTIAADGSSATCTFTGSTPPGATNGMPQNLSFTVDSSAAPGSTLTGSVSVTAPDGTVSSTSPWSVKVVTVAPTITGPANGSNVVNPQTPIDGTGNPGDTVTVRDGAGNTVCAATVQADGTWTCTPSSPLPTGSSTLTPTSVAPNGTSATGAPISITVLPKLQISKNASPSGTVQSGSTVIYTVTVTNPSATAYPNANFSDNLGGVLSSATWNNDITASAGSAQLTGQTLTWNGTVPANGSVTVSYAVTAN